MSRGRLVRAVVVAAAVVATFGVVASLGAQTPSRPIRPVVPTSEPYVFPPIITRTLGNGMRVVIVENHETPIVAVRVVIDSSPLLDPRGKEGLFSVMLSMLGEGTTSITGDQLADSAADMGSVVTPAGFMTLTRNFDRSIQLLSEMFRHPAFPEAALLRVKATRAAALQLTERRPDLAPPRLFAAIELGPDHPYARRPNAASIMAITRDDVIAMHSSVMRPQNVSLVIVGDAAVASILPVLERTFGALAHGGSAVGHVVPAPPADRPTTIYLLDDPRDTVAYLYTGHFVPAESSPDYFATELLNTILGGVPGVGRLHDVLRVQNPYAYFVNTGFRWQPAPEPGTWYGASTVAAGNTAAALGAWLGALKSVGTNEPPTAAEMTFARVNRGASLPIRMETVDAMANALADLVQSRLPLDFITRDAAGVAHVTSDEVAATARKYADPDHMIIIIVGDRATIEPQLRAANIAPVVVVDAAGRPIG